MGLLTWMAKRGTVGGTARWASKNFSVLRNAPNDLENDNEIFQELLMARLDVAFDQGTMELMMNYNQIKGLSGLVVGILSATAGYSENNPDVQDAFYQVICSELHRLGHSDVEIYGDDA